MIINISFCIFNQIIIIYFTFSFLQHTSAEWWLKLKRTRMRRMSKQTNDQAQDVFRRIDRKMRRIMGVKTRSNNIILSFPSAAIHTYIYIWMSSILQLRTVRDTLTAAADFVLCFCRYWLPSRRVKLNTEQHQTKWNKFSTKYEK